MAINKTNSSFYLYDFIKKKVDLAEFLETEVGCTLKWFEVGVAAGTICPMPHHQDNKPSFRLKFIEEEEIWIYHCLGCGSKGTIIDCYDIIFVVAMEYIQEIGFSAREINTIGTFAPTINPLILASAKYTRPFANILPQETSGTNTISGCPAIRL